MTRYINNMGMRKKQCTKYLQLCVQPGESQKQVVIPRKANTKHHAHTHTFRSVKRMFVLFCCCVLALMVVMALPWLRNCVTGGCVLNTCIHVHTHKVWHCYVTVPPQESVAIQLDSSVRACGQPRRDVLDLDDAAATKHGAARRQSRDAETVR